MAPIPESPRSSHQALLDLEKSTESAVLQLKEAARIVGADLVYADIQTHGDRDGAVRGTEWTSAPKEEWVLRWLMKKLKAPQSDASNYRLDANSWLLLRHLINQIPPQKLAVTLSENKFLTILKNAVADLTIITVAGTRDQPLPDDGASESSVTLERSPATAPPKRGRKRKMLECSIGHVEPESVGGQRTPWVPVFLGMLECAKQLVELSDQISGKEEGISFQLKLIFQGDPITTAAILGQAFRLSEITTHGLANLPLVKADQRLASLLLTALEIWAIGSNRLDDSMNSSGNEAFSSYLLSPSLGLILHVRKFFKESIETKRLVQAIERLIVLHVVLPMRQDFFSKSQPDGGDTDSGPDPGQVKSIFVHIGPPLRDNKGSSSMAELLPLMLDIAVRSVPRDTFRRQVNEAPWLEALFVALSALAGCWLTIDLSKDVGPANISVLQDHLQLAMDRKLKLSLHTLSSYAVQFSGLLVDKPKRIEWALISKIIKIGVDVFLPNSGLKDSGRLLNRLYDRITLLWIQRTSISSETYETLKTGIVIPLLSGFSRARDFSAFTKIWNSQLRLLGYARSLGVRLASFAVWEDEDVTAAYGNIVSNSLSDEQITSEIETILLSLNGEGDFKSKPAEQYAQVVKLDAIFTCPLRADGITSGTHILVSITRFLSTAMSLNTLRCGRWRLWRLCRNIVYNSSLPIENLHSDFKKVLFPYAVGLLQDTHGQSRRDLSTEERLEALEAFKLVILFVARAHTSDYNSYLDTLIPLIVPFLLDSTNSLTRQSAVAPAWNGRVETVTSPQALAIGYLVTILGSPLAVSRLSFPNRHLFLDNVVSAVDHSGSAQDCILRIEPSIDSPLKTQLSDVWNGFLSTEWLLNVPSVVPELADILSSRLSEGSYSLKLLVSGLLNVPTQLIPRHQRGKLLDLLQQILLDGEQTLLDLDAEVLTLMTRLAEMPKSPARITSDWEILWKLAISIKLRGTDDDMLIFRSFRQLQTAVVDRVLVSSDVDRQKYFRNTYVKVSDVVMKIKTDDVESMEFFMLRISLSALHIHSRELEDCFQSEDLNKLRERVFHVILSDLQSFRQKTEKWARASNSRGLEQILGNLEDFEDLASASCAIQKSLPKIEHDIGVADYSVHAKRFLVRRVVAIRKSGKENVSSLTQWASMFPLSQLYGEEQRMFFGEFQERFSLMTQEDLTQLVCDLREAGFSGEHASQRALLAGMAVLFFKPVEDRDSPASVELSALFTAVSELLPNSLSIESFCLAAECLEVLLRKQTRSISQWNVDNVMSLISVTLSESGPRVKAEHGGAIYTRLCRLLGMLFGQYRQKLSGRFHLVLPVMQRLLRCLFAPGERLGKFARDAPRWPKWVQDIHGCAIHVEHAAQYTRLLCSLCDPTVSAVQQPRGSHKGLGLNDNTKVVKSLAGQHLQYLVIEYTRCQLRSALTPEMKTALMPGMYAVLAVMSRDTMRAMNAAMDSPSRAVFKGLYDDYVRFGKWDHD